VLDASHAAYPLHSQTTNDWIDLSFISHKLGNRPDVASIHEVTRWLLTHCGSGPRGIGGHTWMRTPIEALSDHGLNNAARRSKARAFLSTRMHWQTLVYVAPYVWNELATCVCHSLLLFSQPVACEILENVWWFFDECAQLTHSQVDWTQRMLVDTSTHGAWYMKLDLRVRLAAHLVLCGDAPLPAATSGHPILHILSRAMQDAFLARILGLPRDVQARLAPLAATWPAHAWKSVAWDFLMQYREPGTCSIVFWNKPDHVAVECGAHLWLVAACAALEDHLVPDLANLALAWLK
jgi:hypothetical protein